MKKKYLLVVAALIVSVLGCDTRAQKTSADILQEQINKQSQTQTEDRAFPLSTPAKEKIDPRAFKPFYVYEERLSKENHYIPSGFMPDGRCVKLETGWMIHCYQGDTCVKIDYDVTCSEKDQRWAGIYWMNPANNWGSRKGGFNLVGAQKLTFWARGEEGGEYIEEVIIGGIEGDYPDSDKVIVGPFILTKDWRQYTVDLRGKDLSYISGGFAWSTNSRANAGKDHCVFYLDEIRFE